MLGRSYSTVIPFAEELAENNLSLTTSPSSLISELVSLSIPLEFNSNNAISNIDPKTYGEILELNTSSIDGGLWGVSFDNSVDKLARTVRSNISYIRNVVCPRMKEFESESMLFIQELGSFNPSSELQILRSKIPEICEDPSFLGMMDSYRDRNVVQPSTKGLWFSFDKAPESFFDVSKTGNSRLDGLVKEWITNSEINYLEKVWYAFFTDSKLNNKYSSVKFNEDNLLTTNIHDKLNISLAYFLIANFYNNNHPDVQITESIETLKTRLFEHKVFAGALVCETLRRINLNDKNNIMVINIDKRNKKIIVCSNIYDRWINTGGKPETILGILVGERHFFSVREIDENLALLDSNWKNYSTVYSESIEYKKASSLRSFYQDLLHRYLIQSDYQDPAEVSYINQTNAFHKNMLMKSERFLHELRKDQLCDCWFIAKNLIAKLKYEFTYAYNFIEDMSKVEEQNKDTSPEEASMIAQINYIVDYLLSQIHVARKSI